MTKMLQNHGYRVQTIGKIERIFWGLGYAVAAKIINNRARAVVFLLVLVLRTTVWLLKNIQAKLEL